MHITEPGSHAASLRVHAAWFKDSVGTKRALLLTEISSPVPKRQLQKQHLSSRQLQKSCGTITRAPHMLQHARSHPPVQANVPGISFWLQQPPTYFTKYTSKI